MDPSAERRRTISLTGRNPVRIVENDWPTIAQSTWGDDALGCHIHIRVRRHGDGRSIIHATFDFPAGGEGQWTYPAWHGRAGRLLEATDPLVTNIIAVGNDLRERIPDTDLHRLVERAVANCIDDLSAFFAHLPAKEI